MRSLTLLTLLLWVPAFAQPSLPTFSFVLAEPGAVVRPLKREVTVLQRSNERIPYVGTSGSWLKPQLEHVLESAPLLKDTGDRWRVYSPLNGRANSHVVVLSGVDTMIIDLPEHEQTLIDRAWSRTPRNTPEVIRFRKGRHAIEALIAGPWPDAAAKTLADRLIAEDAASYQQQLAEQEAFYRNRPPPAPARAPYTPPPPMTAEDFEAYQAQQPPLKDAQVDRVSADSVSVRITGRVMLDGDCASGMPVFGIEMLTDTGWVERIPFSMIQMYCGMPWADWDDHLVVIPLRWWVGAHQPEGKKELASGRYRLFFVGGNGKRLWTAPFAVQ
jgi:hypothetical protein